MTSHASVDTVKSSVRASFIMYALSILMGYGLLEDRNGEIRGVGEAASLEEIAGGDEGLELGDVAAPAGQDPVFLVQREAASSDESDESDEGEAAKEPVKEAMGKPRRVVMSDSDSDSDSDSEADERAAKGEKLTKEQKIKKEARYLLKRQRKNGRSVAYLGARIDPRWLIVIDGYNVARNLNKDRFDAKCIQMAVEYFEKLGCRAYAVTHDFLESTNKKGTMIITKKDQELLKAMRQKKQVYVVPGQAYDDSYVVKTAMEENGLIVTNDNYRDFSDNKHFDVDMDLLRSRLISFSFVGDKFRMNPEFECPTYPDDFTDDE